MYFVDYHNHPASHGEKRVKPIHNLDILNNFGEEAKSKDIQELGLSDHDSFLDSYNWDNLNFLKKNSMINIKIGIEIDYFPDKEVEIKNKLSKYPFDYVIGSVHHIDGWNFDNKKYISQYKNWNKIDLYKRYFKILRKAVQSELFEIIGHFDLIKIFNKKLDKKKVISLIKPVLHDIKDKDIAIEINVNGLNKPVGEIYPAYYIIKEAIKLDIPLTFGSDSHIPSRVGENIKRIYEMILKLGVNKIATFQQREMTLVDLEKEV